MDWDDYEDPGSSEEFNEGELGDGFQVDGEGGLDSGYGNDAADGWLSSAEASVLDLDAEMAESLPESYMGASTNVLQEGRIDGLSPTVAAGVRHAARGGQISGIDSLDLAVAVEDFQGAIDGSADAFATARIKETQVSPTTVTRYDDEGFIRSKDVIHNPLGLPNSKRDKKAVLSILGGVREYEEAGPGSKLAGHTLNTKKNARAEEKLIEAFNTASEIAEVMISDKTPKDSHIYGARKEALTNVILGRAMEGTQGKYGKSIYAQTILALPNETGITGIKPTRAYRGGAMGTPFDRLGFDIYADSMGLESTDDKYWELKPSLKHSLFPIQWKKDHTEEEKAKAKRDQTYQMGQLMTKATGMRDTLQEAFPTNRDESARQGRMSGFDRTVDEQADRMNAIDQAHSLDIDGSKEAGDETRHTDMDRFIDNATEYVPAMLSNKAREEAQLDIAGVSKAIEDQFGIQGIDPEEFVGPNITIEGIDQRTTEWYAARKGLITASKLTDDSGRKRTVAEMAADLARERLGEGKEFLGNAHTQEGVEGERKALSAFLSVYGDEVGHTEVGLLQNKDLPGLGASPDGRLHNLKTGESEGLIELKYLSDGAMEGALKKYTPQMQLQMAVTGESQTHFFALNKHTGASKHEVVFADPKMQEEIIKNGAAAMDLAKSIKTKKEVQALEDLTQEQRRKGKGQQESYSLPSDEPEQAMGVYPGQDNDKLAKFIAASQESIKGQAESAAYKEEGQRAKALRAEGKVEQAAYTEDAKRMATMGKLEQAAYGEDNKRAEKRGKLEHAAYAEDNKRSYNMGKAEHQAYIENTKRASKAVEDFADKASSAAKGLVAVAAEIGGVLREGADSAMDTMSFAGSVGMEANEVRGMEFELTTGKGGLKLGQARSNLRSLAGVRDNLTDDTSAGAEMTRMQKAYYGTRLHEITGKDFNPHAYRGKSVNYMYADMLDRSEGQSEKTQALIGKVFNVDNIANTVLTGDDLRGVEGEIDQAGIRAFQDGAVSVDQFGQEVLENSAATTGEIGGKGAAISQWTDRASNSKTAAAALGVLGAGKAAAANPVAVARAANMARAGATRALPAAAVAGAVYAARDGGPLDHRGEVTSGLAKGMSDGLRNFEFSDLIPKNKWAYTTPKDKAAEANVNNNIEVKVNVDPSLKVKTAVDVDGDESIDEGTGWGGSNR